MKLRYIWYCGSCLTLLISAGFGLVYNKLIQIEQVLPKDEVTILHTLNTTLVGTWSVSILLITLCCILIHRGISTGLFNFFNTLSNSISHISQTSANLRFSSFGLSDVAQSQAASLEETAATMEEISVNTRYNAEKVKEVHLSVEVNTGEIKSIIDTTNELTESMALLTQSNKSVNLITETIESIAFQINLLSLNAAVEAARAGEAGAGFSIVAEEVRNLAAKASNSANDISTLLETITSHIDSSNVSASAVNAAIIRIDESSDKTLLLLNDVDNSISEQAVGIQQINLATSELDQSVQNTAAESIDLANSSSHMVEVSNRLNSLFTQTLSNLDATKIQRRLFKQKVTNPKACWNVLGCPTDRFTKCPSYPDHGQSCHSQDHTLCKGIRQGLAASKVNACRGCRMLL